MRLEEVREYSTALVIKMMNGGVLAGPTVRDAVPGEYLGHDYSSPILLDPDPGGRAINRNGGDSQAPHQLDLSNLHRAHCSSFSMEETYKANGSHAASSALVAAGAGDTAAERRKGKQAVLEDGADEERTPIIVNMARARGAVRVRLLAVGVFLSILTMPSKHLVNYMKKVWRIRGMIETNQLADRRFVLEFSEVGDFEHVTRGGPWRHQNDAVLIRALKDGEDPNEVKFETVPIWVQFTDIPFYLLSKELARNLGKKLGELISIDNNARGDLQDKILRARIKPPVARALQRWIILRDESNNEDVVVSAFYERLPTFCLCCGVIGHQEAECDLPATLRRRRYEPSLGVKPTHIDDHRSWYLPATAGDNGRALQLPLPWRSVPSQETRNASPRAPQLAAIAHVAKEVEKLTVQDKMQRTIDANNKSVLGSGSIGTCTGSQAPDVSLTLVECDNSTSRNVIDSAATVIANDTTTLNTNDNNIKHVSDTTTEETNATDKAEEKSVIKKSWKRRAREGADHAAERMLELAPAVGGLVLGKRAYAADDKEIGCDTADTNGSNAQKKNKVETDAVLRNEDPGEDGGQEATSPGAAGQLTGASVGACQEP